MFSVLDVNCIIYKSQNVLDDWKMCILEIDFLCWLALIHPVSFLLCSTACIETGNGTSLNLNLHQYIDATSKPPAKWECLNVEQDLHAWPNH